MVIKQRMVNNSMRFIFYFDDSKLLQIAEPFLLVYSKYSNAVTNRIYPIANYIFGSKRCSSFKTLRKPVPRIRAIHQVLLQQ
jgi:hypothetical protein